MLTAWHECALCGSTTCRVIVGWLASCRSSLRLGTSLTSSACEMSASPSSRCVKAPATGAFRYVILREPPPPRYVAEYATFFLVTAILLSVLHLLRRYRLVQVNSIPDVLVLAAAVPRLLGARILLDLQECMPEFLATKFGLHGAPPCSADAEAIGAAQHSLCRSRDHPDRADATNIRHPGCQPGQDHRGDGRFRRN